jgi:hypothetical protein
MKIENTTTEEITKLLCQVMESKAGQTDGEIVDEFEKLLKQRCCTHPIITYKYTVNNLVCCPVPSDEFVVETAAVCARCGKTLHTYKHRCAVACCTE